MFRRYLVNFNLDSIIKDIYDVIIVGSGIAGLYTALNINHKYKVLILSKDDLDVSNSNLAQGGVAACINPEDNKELHVKDTLIAGCYYNHVERVKLLVEEAKENIDKLIRYGTDFDRDKTGKLLTTREGGHSQRRILHSRDITGKEIVGTLIKEVKRRNNITVLSHLFAIDVIDNKGKCVGVICIKNNKLEGYLSKATILATGGIGQVYKNTTNSSISTGDGIGIAYRAGVEIVDMEFVQFHPTALYIPDEPNRFLISEALRGEGAVLRNFKGETFMENYHHLKDLAPRNVVSKAIFEEMIRDRQEYVYLDITHRDKEFIKSRFPNIYKKSLEKGIDITRDYIPISPVQHYLMGGIRVNDNCKTSLKNLYACGEVACTGVHGANRLASNSLLEGLVFGNRLAKEINNNIDKEIYKSYEISNLSENPKIDKKQIIEIKSRVKGIMNKHAFIVRNKKGLNEALKSIEKILAHLNRCYSTETEYFECVNMSLTAFLILKSALSREESLGSHIIIE